MGREVIFRKTRQAGGTGSGLPGQPPAELNISTTYTERYVVSQFERISIFLLPIFSAAGNSLTDVDQLMAVANVGDTLYPVKGAVGGTALVNEVFSYTTEDLPREAGVRYTTGLAVPDGGVELVVVGYRG